jgi:hypothetical protein
MTIIYFGVVLVAIWLLVEVLAIVFRITGLNAQKARFQVISILTHTGFTTRESELIAQHPLRRKLASALMLVSYLAQVSLISLLLNMITQNITQLLYVGLGLLVFVALFVFATRNKFVARKIDNLVERIIARRIIKQTKKRSVDQVLKISPDFAVYEILVDGESILANTALDDADLSKMFIHVLKIDRGNKTIDFPAADSLIQVGDVLIVYGKIKSIMELAKKSK